MKRILVFIFFVIYYFQGFTETKFAEKQNILNLLDKQVEAWNEGNLEKFMETYWNSEKLVFVGSRGPTYGWQETLSSYKKGYPDKVAMGKLNFKILKISKIDKKTVFVIGRFDLKREIGNVSGFFTLNIQKIKGKWLIVSDHSSAD
jgi:hypothetical protein